MFERFSNNSGFQMDSILSIVAYIALVAQLSCLFCSAQNQPKFPLTEFTNSRNNIISSSWPFPATNRADDNLQSRQQVVNPIEPCRSRPGGCTVFDRLRRHAPTSCIKLSWSPISNRFVCVPQSANITQHIEEANVLRSPEIALKNQQFYENIDEDEYSATASAAESSVAEANALVSQLEFIESRLMAERQQDAHLQDLDSITPLDKEAVSSAPFGRSFARKLVPIKSNLDDYDDSASDLGDLCWRETLDNLSDDELANCLISTKFPLIGRTVRANSRATHRFGTEGRVDRFEPIKNHHFRANIQADTPKRNNVGRPNWAATTKSFLRELREIDGTSESSFGERNRSQTSSAKESTLIDEQRFRSADSLQVQTSSPESVTLTAGSISGANDLVDPMKPPGCQMRDYVFKAINRDNKGNQCSGYLKAKICYGSCDTGEIADWLFPHKKSIHKVCQHGVRQRRKVILLDCNSELAHRELNVYHYVDALTCVCDKCNKATTTCMASLTAPKL